MKKQKTLAVILLLSLVLSVLPAQNTNASILSGMQNATEIQENQLYGGSIGSEEDTWFKFTTGSEYKDYCISLVSDKDDWIAFYDTNAALVQEELVLSGSFIAELKENTTYYIRAYSTSPLHEFALQIGTQSDIPDKMEDAKTISLGTLSESTLSYRKDQDWYKFKTPAFANYKLTCTAGSSSFYVRVYDTNKKLIYSEFCMGNSSEEETFEFAKGKTYYIQFEGYDGGSRDALYTFIVNRSSVTKLQTVPAFSKLTGGNKKVALSWKKTANAKGYQIRYSTSSSMSKAKTVSTTAASKTISGLKKGKTYYFQIRAYATNDKGKKVYSDWSSVSWANTK